MDTSHGQNENTPAELSPISFPGALSCYRFGWGQMKKYFFNLLLIVIVAWLISIPSVGMHIHDVETLLDKFFVIDPFFPEFAGYGYYVLLALIYTALIEGPVEYGIAFSALRVARNQGLQTKNLFAAFNNYLSAVRAYLLVIIIVVTGFFLLIIPGIIFLCKLAFVPYLITDKKMNAVPAVKESWQMTKGHTSTIFLMYVIAFFLSILGLLLAGVGLIFAVIWIEPSFAHLYHTVSISQERGNPSEVSA